MKYSLLEVGSAAGRHPQYASGTCESSSHRVVGPAPWTRRRARRSSVRGMALCAGLLMLVAGCQTPDQTIVQVELDPSAPATDVFRATVSSASHERLQQWEFAYGDLEPIATIPVGDGEGVNAPRHFEILAEQVREGEVVAWTYARSELRPGGRRYLRLRLYPDCEPGCRLGQRCVDGACRDACLQPTLAEGEEPVELECEPGLAGACGECTVARGGTCAPLADGTPCGCELDRCDEGRCVPATPVASVSAGSAHACLTQEVECGPGSTSGACMGLCPADQTCSGWETQRVYCWGANGTTPTEDDGRLGVAGDPDALVSSFVADDLDLRWGFRFALGARHTCVRSWDAVLRCFGANAGQQLGTPDALAPGESYTLRSPVDGSVRGWVLAAAGESHTCAAFVPDIGTTTQPEDTVQIYCWGSDGGEALGDGPGGAGIRAASGPAIWSGTRPDDVALSARNQATCGILGGELLCWGTNGSGAFGDVSVLPAPTRVELPSPPLQVGLGSGLLCVRTESDILCRGVNDGGELGRGTVGTGVEASSSVFAPIAMDGPWLDMAVGRRHVCAVRAANGLTYCWGQNRFGELGPAATFGVASGVPRPSGIDEELVELAAGDGFTCGRTELGALYCWGDGKAAGGGVTAPRGTVTHVCPPLP